MQWPPRLKVEAATTSTCIVTIRAIRVGGGGAAEAEALVLEGGVRVGDTDVHPALHDFMRR